MEVVVSVCSCASERRLVLIPDSAGASETNVDRRERLRKLALETIDLAKVGRNQTFVA
jgi:hypothetical protein